MKRTIIFIIMSILVAIAASSCNSRADYMLDNGKILNIYQAEYADYVQTGDTVVVVHNVNLHSYKINGIYQGQVPDMISDTYVMRDDTIKVLLTYHKAVKLQ